MAIKPTYEELQQKVKAQEGEISDFRKAEKVQQETEKQYKSLIQRIQAAIVLHGADTQIIASNPKAQELLGLTEDQMLGKTAIDPDWKFLRAQGVKMALRDYPVNQVMPTRQPLRDLTVGVYRPDRDDLVWALVNADPVFDDKGEIQQVIVTFVDITERKRSEQVLQEKEARYRELFVSNPHPMWIYDLESLAFLDVNNAAISHYRRRCATAAGQCRLCERRLGQGRELASHQEGRQRYRSGDYLPCTAVQPASGRDGVGERHH